MSLWVWLGLAVCLVAAAIRASSIRIRVGCVVILMFAVLWVALADVRPVLSQPERVCPALSRMTLQNREFYHKGSDQARSDAGGIVLYQALGCLGLCLVAIRAVAR
jgi:hypothetical protein